MELAASLLLLLSSLFTSVEAEINEPQTVEIGLAEVSPLGEEGGYAIPASGCASPHPHPYATCPIVWLNGEIDDGVIVDSGDTITSIQGGVANVGDTDISCHSYQIWVEGTLIGSSGCSQPAVPADGVYRIPNYPVSYTAPTLAVSGVVAMDLRFCVDHPSNASPNSDRCDNEYLYVVGTGVSAGPDITANGQDTTEIINAGDNVNVIWQPNGNTNCTLSEPLPGGVHTLNGGQVESPNGQITYSITCDEGQDSVTVYVLPEYEET